MSPLQWKRKIGQFWPQQLQQRKLILLYHSVGNSEWGTPEKAFIEQVQWLTDHYRVLSLNNLIESKHTDELQVAITFDDGYVSLHEKALPILMNKKLSALVYLNTGWISELPNQRKPSQSQLGHYPGELFMSWQEVKELHNAGWEIGSHGVNHYNFSATEEKVTRQELFASKIAIEEKLNISCNHFSYPWGKYTNKVKNIAKEVGYTYAASACHGPLKPNSDLFSLPRVNIARDYSLEDFKNILRGKWDYLRIFQQAKRIVR